MREIKLSRMPTHYIEEKIQEEKDNIAKLHKLLRLANIRLEALQDG